MIVTETDTAVRFLVPSSPLVGPICWIAILAFLAIVIIAALDQYLRIETNP